MEFPTLLYKVPGKHFGNYDYKGCPDKEAYADLKVQGWHDSIEEARAGGHAEKVIDAAQELEAAIDEISPPSRKELETKAKELGLSFNHRTKDEVLAKRIADAV